MRLIDLRSDTVTRPTPAMRQAMFTAEVGDDVMGEDPTVNRLERMVADIFGCEAAVFACSGTQSNQIAVRLHCIPGDELLIHESSHICNFEAGAPAALSGVTVRTLTGPAGMLDVCDLEGRVRVNDQHFCRTQLVCLENTTNLGGGRVYPLAQLQRVSAWAQASGLKRHLDGARLFNAIVAGNYSAADVASCFDTISICFSKGLGCPVGSMLLGTAADMARARRIRKLFGGGLRQAGMLAAAAVHALENHVDRLADDHLHAQQLAAAFKQLPGIIGISPTIETNLVFFELDSQAGTAVQFAGAMRDRGVLIGPMGGQRVRLVTHIDVSADDIQTTISAAADALQQGFRDRPVQGKGPFSR